MEAIITKLTDREIPEHWRVLVSDKDVELLHDSATSKVKAVEKIVRFLASLVVE